MTNLFGSIIELPVFTKEFKKLSRKYKTLPDDFATFIKVQLKLFHKKDIDNGGIVRIDNLGFEEPPIYKVKKFACQALKGKGSRTGIRIIYSYIASTDTIKFIEIYLKQNKSLENKKRIIENFKKE